ncbi:Arylsulfatase [Hondaea fermentalgiana]|uniref:Arylsulfatase n=1 Tax=Hondaea fermentalgiana TaxID=2315210 RepID=A0A2R5GUK6_9STRA|nr:Arylsulfatase [Hondaea fermentalgiana]|eukprot:GBG31574.1 Arylsulfatase [Hondaea fermentalgiana]
MAAQHRKRWSILAALVAALSSCGSAAGKGICLVQVREFTRGDWEALPSDLRKDLEDDVPVDFASFRSSSPDLVPAEAAVVTGEFPALLGIHNDDDTKPALGPRLHQSFFEAGYKVGHFGRWAFADETLETYTSSVLQSDGFTDVIDAAKAFVKERVADGEDFLAVVMLPRLDAAFGYGLDDVTADDWNADIEGPSEERWSTCPDVSRAKVYEPRYATCPRQVYQANRVHEMRQVAKLMSLVSKAFGSDALRIVYSSTGGEAEQVDAHARGRFGHRGERRSLYDGGLRGILRFSAPQGSKRALVRKSQKADVAGVDLLPTLAGWANVKVKQASQVAGVDLSSVCLVKGCSRVAREQPLVWEWRFGVPGHCMNESPRFAILKGSFKLFYEPASESDGVEARYELYDLSRGEFELTNLWGATPKASASQKRLEQISEEMEQDLLAWVARVPSSPTALAHTGCAGGPASVTSSPDASPTAASWPQSSLRSALRGIVFILADDMGFGDVSANHDARRAETGSFAYTPSTPDFDRLMSEGVQFTQFYANSCVCSPSRAAMLSGRLPSHADVRMHNIVDKKPLNNKRRGVPAYLGEGVSPSKFSLMPRFFHDQGFVTAHFGKWHLGYTATDDWDADGALYGLDEYQLYGHNKALNKTQHVFPTASSPHDTYFDNRDPFFSSYAQQLMVNRTLAFLSDRAADERKFYVQLCLQNPHAPLVLATSYDQAAANGFASASSNPWPHRGDRSVPFDFVDPHVPHQIYQTLLREHERAVMDLVDGLADLGLDDKTLVIHTADNGPEERAVYFTLAGDVAPFRGAKRSLYEGGIHVPMLMRWPGHIPAGSVFGEVASGVDLFPTLAGLAGYANAFASLPDASRMQGRDISCGLLRSCAPAEAAPAEPLFFEFRNEFMGDCLGISPRFAVRNGTYKLLWEPQKVTDWYPNFRTKTMRMELYDLTSDPFESTNLLWTQAGNAAVQAVADRMLDALIEYTSSTQYDHSLRPSTSWAKAQARADMTASSFYLDESCVPSKKTWWKLRPPSDVSLTSNQVSQVLA